VADAGGAAVRHFNLHNSHEIKDTDGGLWATVLFTDREILGELSRRGFIWWICAVKFGRCVGNG
jgi:hypothetical protein